MPHPSWRAELKVSVAGYQVDYPKDDEDYRNVNQIDD